MRLPHRAPISPLALGIALSAGLPSAHAATYYAAPGNISGNGSMNSPFSLNQAAQTASAGDTVYLRGGNYSGTLRPANSGNSGAWITFAAYPGELPIFNGNGSGGTAIGSSTAQYIRFIGIAARNYSSTGFGNGWTNGDCNPMSNGNMQFINCIADGNGINGIAFYCASGVLVEQSIIAHNGNMMPSWSSGVNLFHVTGSASANVVRQTVSFENIDISSHRSDGSGFILDQNSTGATFVNNIGFRNGGSCIRLTNSPNSVIQNNTCFNNGIDSNVQYHEEIFYSDPTSRNGAILRNNVAVASSGNNALFGATGVSQQNNHFLNNAAPSPFFTSSSGVLDFNLTSGASQLIDAGTASGAPSNDIGFDPACIKQQAGQAVSWWNYAIDYDYIADIGGVANCFNPANRQGTPDIGAYEYGGPPTGGSGGAGGSAGGGGSGGKGGGGGSGGTLGGSTGQGGAAGSAGTANGGTSGTAGTAGSGSDNTGGIGGTGGGSDTGGAFGAGGSGGSDAGGVFGAGGSAGDSGGVFGGAGTGGGGTFGAGGVPSGGGAALGGVGGLPSYGGAVSAPMSGGAAGSSPRVAPRRDPTLEPAGCACASVGTRPAPVSTVLATLLGLLAVTLRRRTRR